MRGGVEIEHRVDLRELLTGAVPRIAILAALLLLATYTGVVLEGFVIDTDHWRHYYLLMGIIWGLVIATLNAERRAYLRAAI